MRAGARLATVAVISGALATAVSVLGVAYVAVVGSSSESRVADATRLASQPLPARLQHFERAAGDPAEGDVAPVIEHRIGDIVLVDIAPYVVSLDDELDRQRATARLARERLLVWLVVSDCRTCQAVETALPSAELQKALAGTRLVRLSATDFIAELSRLGVPVDALPGFVLLGPDGRARDYMHGGEWEKDVPQSIAPVLKSFVEGTYVQRRRPWHGGPHDDETTI